MKIVMKFSTIAWVIIILGFLTVGCGILQPRHNATASSDVEKIVKSSYNAKTETVVITLTPDNTVGIHPGSEDLINATDPSAITNYATAAYSNNIIQHVRIDYLKTEAAIANAKMSKTMNVPSDISKPVNNARVIRSHKGKIKIPPKGVHIGKIKPKARKNAPAPKKTRAVLSVAKSKLGTPYIWGHNEDRGQYGFDCSNFVEYVYHHALGYRFTCVSRKQAKHVGIPIPLKDRKPGDLLIFEHGKHVGIYMGNDQMIQEGGGLGKVGVLGLGPGSYWGKRITAVKRMY